MDFVSGTLARGQTFPLLTVFNGSFRDECLSANWFLSLAQAGAPLKLGDVTTTAA